MIKNTYPSVLKVILGGRPPIYSILTHKGADFYVQRTDDSGLCDPLSTLEKIVIAFCEREVAERKDKG